MGNANNNIKNFTNLDNIKLVWKNLVDKITKKVDDAPGNENYLRKKGEWVKYEAPTVSIKTDDKSISGNGTSADPLKIKLDANPGNVTLTTDNGLKASHDLPLSKGTGIDSIQQNNCKASNNYSHAEGYQTAVTGIASHIEGGATNGIENIEEFSNKSQNDQITDWETTKKNSIALGNYSHVEGLDNFVIGHRSHAEGSNNLVTGIASHAEGQEVEAKGNYSHAEGYQTAALGIRSHAEGYLVKAKGDYSHAEGYKTVALGGGSHIEGGANSSIENIEEFLNKPQNDQITDWETKKSSITLGNYSHVEGNSNFVIGQRSHAEGAVNLVVGNNSHAEGQGVKVYGANSHAEGFGTIVKGENSHAEGFGTITNNEEEHASGKFNNSVKSNYLSESTQFSIGNGNKDERKNLFEIKKNGATYIKGIGGFDGDNYNESDSLNNILIKNSFDGGLIKTSNSIYGNFYKNEYKLKDNKDSQWTLNSNSYTQTKYNKYGLPIIDFNDGTRRLNYREELPNTNILKWESISNIPLSKLYASNPDMLIDRDFIKCEYININDFIQFSKNTIKQEIYKRLDNGYELKIYYHDLPEERYKNTPFIIFIHGGGWQGGKAEDVLNNKTEGYLSNLGFKCFSIEYRLMEISGNKPINSAKTCQDSLDDIKDAVNYIKNNYKKFNINPKLYAYLGHSAGGHLSILSSFNDNECSGTISYSPICDIVSFYEDRNINIINNNIINNYFDFKTDNGAKYNPSTLIESTDIKVPMTIFAGSLDYLVNTKKTENFAKQLQFQNKNCDFVSFELSGHTIYDQINLNNNIVYTQDVSSELCLIKTGIRLNEYFNKKNSINIPKSNSNTMILTQTDYEKLSYKDPNTIYFIKEV